MVSARDLARYGLLYARRGRWGDEQIISASWVAESTSPHSDAGAFGGYGYMWWIAVDGRHLPNVTLAEGSFSAQVELHDGRLLVDVGDVGRFELAPITSTRYRIEHWRGAKVGFSIDENRIETMALTLCDSRTLEFKPTGESGGS